MQIGLGSLGGREREREREEDREEEQWEREKDKDGAQPSLLLNRLSHKDTLTYGASLSLQEVCRGSFGTERSSRAVASHIHAATNTFGDLLMELMKTVPNIVYRNIYKIRTMN